MHSVNNVDEGMTNTRPLIPDVPFHPGLTYRPPPKPIRTNIPRSKESSQSKNSSENKDFNTYINLDFEEHFPFQEGIISEAYHRPEKLFFQELHALNDLINTGNLIQKFLPKQTDIDKILKIIQRKVLKDTHLMVEIKEIQAGYLNSPYFKDIYLYLAKINYPALK